MSPPKICLANDVRGNRDVIDNERNGLICHRAEEYARRINEILHNKQAGLTDHDGTNL